MIFIDFKQMAMFFVAGDWKARVGNKRDFIVWDLTINPINDQSYASDSQLTRNSMESKTNCFGKKLDMCISTWF